MKVNPFAALVVIALLGFSVYYIVKQHNEKVEADRRIEVLLNNEGKQSTVIMRYIAPDSTKHVNMPELPGAKTPNEKGLAISQEYVDSLQKALNIANRQLVEVRQVTAIVQGTGKMKESKDSTGSKVFTFNNGFLDFLHKDSTGTYKYNVAFNDVKYYKGDWFTGKRYYHDLHFADPNAYITSVGGFTIPEAKPKRFGIGLQTGYYLDPTTGKIRPSVGFGLSFNLIRF